MRKITPVIVVVIFFLFTGLMPPPTEDTNAKIKAVFLYNFTKYIEWPKTYKEGNFIIGLYGINSSLSAELNKMAATKSVGTQKFEIKTMSSLDGANKCHMLFIPSTSGGQFSEVVSKLKGQSTLIITEKPGLTKQGAAINFVVQDNKQKFELNKANAEKYDLKVSSNLASLAVVVE